MLFKPDLNETAKAAGDRVARVASRARRRTVSIAITLLILGGLGYIAWTAMQQKQAGEPGARVPICRCRCWRRRRASRTCRSISTASAPSARSTT